MLVPNPAIRETRWGRGQAALANLANKREWVVAKSIFLLVVLRMFTGPLSAQDPFSGIGVSEDYVPEGKSKRQSRISTVEQCQAACAVNHRCKAFAFRTLKPACYFYSQVYMGGSSRSRSIGLYSSALSIVPKKGFVSAFKPSSFPPPPVLVQHPD